MMFYKILNEQVKQFINRAKGGYFSHNIIKGKKDYYVEYYQESLYWVYSYETNKITMIYARSPYDAVKMYERW